jgi:hypothetical protein
MYVLMRRENNTLNYIFAFANIHSTCSQMMIKGKDFFQWRMFAVFSRITTLVVVICAVFVVPPPPPPPAAAGPKGLDEPVMPVIGGGGG